MKLIGVAVGNEHVAKARRICIANFMDSSLKDLETKGVFSSVGNTYNPGKAYAKVLHFTPHEKDLSLASQLREYGVEIHAHKAGGISPLRILQTIHRVWKLIGSEKIDLVRGRLPYLGSLIGCIAARLRGIPCVVSLGGDNRIGQERNNSYNYKSRWISYGMEWLVLCLATAIIVPNEFTRRYVEKIIGKPAAQKCETIHWISEPVEETPEGMDCDEIPNDNCYILIVGFLNRYKFTDVLFDTIANLDIQCDAQGKTIKFVFCGDGPLREEGQDRFAHDKRVEFLGWTERRQVHGWMRKARIVLIPMSGNVLLEAASIGIPVVTSDLEWHSEAVQNGKTGLVVRPQDPEAWATAIRTILEHPETGRKMGRQLKELYWGKYAPSLSIAAEHALYIRLVEGQQP